MTWIWTPLKRQTRAKKKSSKNHWKHTQPPSSYLCSEKTSERRLLLRWPAVRVPLWRTSSCRRSKKRKHGSRAQERVAWWQDVEGWGLVCFFDGDLGFWGGAHDGWTSWLGHFRFEVFSTQLWMYLGWMWSGLAARREAKHSLGFRLMVGLITYRYWLKVKLENGVWAQCSANGILLASYSFEKLSFHPDMLDSWCKKWGW